MWGQVANTFMVRRQHTVLILVAPYFAVYKSTVVSFPITRTKLICRLLGSNAVSSGRNLPTFGWWRQKIHSKQRWILIWLHVFTSQDRVMAMVFPVGPSNLAHKNKIWTKYRGLQHPNSVTWRSQVQTSFPDRPSLRPVLLCHNPSRHMAALFLTLRERVFLKTRISYNNVILVTYRTRRVLGSLQQYTRAVCS